MVLCHVTGVVTQLVKSYVTVAAVVVGYGGDEFNVVNALPLIGYGYLKVKYAPDKVPACVLCGDEIPQ